MYLFDIVIFSAKDYELKRDNVKLYEVLGEGQFGDVYKGAWTDKVCLITIGQGPVTVVSRLEILVLYFNICPYQSHILLDW